MRLLDGFAHIDEQAVEGDLFLNIAAEESGDIVDAFDGADDPFNGNVGGEGGQFFADIDIADVCVGQSRAAFTKNCEIAE